ncbi:uncharacterized protein LOC132902946 [Amyelois transitella]|uniref:uncharacterized protein LOC132902946 n=1 Tax=Amyelois transitella TaxID=680683 RepID=UPI00299030AA|nr:uncharacterized protein LOC132902946 [Amyelois transitella]
MRIPPAIFHDILTLQENTTGNIINNDLDIKFNKTRRSKKSYRSTSSSSGSKQVKSSKDSQSGESLELDSITSSSQSGEKKDRPKSSLERKRWRKWHRKCHPCPEDMAMKWRDPGIKWICGAYQRARRSFKSLCMMHFRNCQDGTMFTKIADHRCKNDTQNSSKPHGDHFFYDYKVRLSGESSRDSLTSSISSDRDDSKDIYSYVDDVGN